MTVSDLLWHLQQLDPDTRILGWRPIDEGNDYELSANVNFKLEKVQLWDRGIGQVLIPIPAKPDPRVEQETVLIINIE